MNDKEQHLAAELIHHLETIYPEHDCEALARRLITEIAPVSDTPPGAPLSWWSERDAVLITYGDSVLPDTGNGSTDTTSLNQLSNFLSDHIGDRLSIVHILPFFPYSSDDGFAVMDYVAVNPELGDWADIRRIGENWRLMGDLVINHASAGHAWFKQFERGEKPGLDYFVEEDPATDLSAVVRPRTSPLLRETPTPSGTRHVWCTFGHDQVDLNFSNPDVLIEFVRILRRYIDESINIFRLDAVGFLWKDAGTSCIHLEQTHEIVRLLRRLIVAADPNALIITETNVPNHENLTYFGNRNEAHVIYNFSLAPLLLHALMSGESRHLRSWMMSMPPAPTGCTYLNFTASHDGIGMRPAEGLLSEQEIDTMIGTVENFGGLISKRTLSDGSERCYEMNIALYDAMAGTQFGPDELQFERFICSQTIMMGLEGIPAFYIHSILGTGNDYDGVKKTQRNRSINRKRWHVSDIDSLLEDSSSSNSRVHRELMRLLEIRREQPGFHPNATQFTLQLGKHIFGFWRQSLDRDQSVFCISNIDRRAHNIRLEDINLISTDNWVDLISNTPLQSQNDRITLKPYQTIWLTNRQSQT